MQAIEFIGRLTKDVEMSVIPERDLTIGKFSVAVDRKKNKNGETKTDFFNVVCFNKQAENVKTYTHKGSKVYVRGELQHEEYDAKDGTKRFSLNVMPGDIIFLDNKKDDSQNQDNSNLPKEWQDGDKNDEQKNEPLLPWEM